MLTKKQYKLLKRILYAQATIFTRKTLSYIAEHLNLETLNFCCADKNVTISGFRQSFP